MTEKAQPRKLRVGLWSEGGELISDSRELDFDSRSESARERETAVRLLLTKSADAFNGKEVMLRFEEAVSGTTHFRTYRETRYTLRRAFIRTSTSRTRMTALDDKINDRFPGLVVRKDLVKAVKGNAIVPSFVSEYLSGQYCATNDEASIQSGIETVQGDHPQALRASQRGRLVRSNIKEKGPWRVIDKVSVTLNDKDNVYEADVRQSGHEKVVIDSPTIKVHPKLLVSGVWCIGRRRVSTQRGDEGDPWILGSHQADPAV